MTMLEGGCLCGAIRYRMAGQPARVTLCHCRYCQRITGSAYLVQPAYRESEFTLLQGEPRVYTHISEGSGKAVHRHYCADCGTNLLHRLDRFLGALGLLCGTLDDPASIEVTPENAKHIFVRSARPDTVLPAATPIYRDHAMDNDGVAIAPILLDHPCRAGDL